MPITKHNIKAARQNLVRRARNKKYDARMRTMMKKMLALIAASDVENAKKMQAAVVSAIDVALKKKLIHKNNAAHKKARIQKSLNALAKAK
jgi:small subunit ribosomal protein S20